MTTIKNYVLVSSSWKYLACDPREIGGERLEVSTDLSRAKRFSKAEALELIDFLFAGWSYYPENEELHSLNARILSSLEMDRQYAELLNTQAKLRWNILVSAIKEGRKVTIDGLEVIEASNDRIVAHRKLQNITIVISKASSLVNHDIRYFDEKGKELINPNPFGA